MFEIIKIILIIYIASALILKPLFIRFSKIVINTKELKDKIIDQRILLYISSATDGTDLVIYFVPVLNTILCLVFLLIVCVYYYFFFFGSKKK